MIIRVNQLFFYYGFRDPILANHKSKTCWPLAFKYNRNDCFAIDCKVIKALDSSEQATK